MRILTALLVVLAGPVHLAAQSTGGGISSSGSERGAIHWVYAYVGEDSLQLRAVVVLRGRPGWMTPTDSAEALRSRAAVDSIRNAETRARRADGVGYAVGRARVWIGNDLRRGRVRFQEQNIPWLLGDSIVVITVDRVDHVGGPPLIARFSLPPVSPARVPLHDLFDAMEAWHSRLLRDARIAAVLP